MRCGPFLVMLALLVGTAPAPAQDSPGIIPMPKQDAKQETKQAPKLVKHKAVAAKPAEAKSAEVEPIAKPARAKSVKNAGRSPATGKPGMVKNAIEGSKAAKSAAVKGEATPEAKPDVKPEAKLETKAMAKPEAKAAPDADVLMEIAPNERRKIQAALLWSGDYGGPSGGEDPMLAAIKNFQKRHKAKITGVLTSSERADLIAAAKAHEAEYGWNVVVDPATGIRIGLPSKMVPQCARYRARHALVVGAWRGAGRNLPHQRDATSRLPRCSNARRRSRRRAGSRAARCMTTASPSAACRA